MFKHSHYEVHGNYKGYTGSDAARVKVRASAYDPGRERGVKEGLVPLRIGSLNVTSMKKKDGEVVDMAAFEFLLSSGDCMAKVQESWASTSFSGWAVQKEFRG